MYFQDSAYTAPLPMEMYLTPSKYTEARNMQRAL